MKRDLRDTRLYKESYLLYKSLVQAGGGLISDGADIQLSPDGQCAAFTGTIVKSIEAQSETRIALINLASGSIQTLTQGPGSDRLPKYSPDGRYIAFLSDRGKPGDFQLQLIDSQCGSSRSGTHVPGWIEYLQWSPDGQRILLGVAEHGADVAGGQGAIPSRRVDGVGPAWLPDVDVGREDRRSRQAWVYEVNSGSVLKASPENFNVWEAVWCGNSAIAAVVSSGASEGLWYSATLRILDLNTGSVRELYKAQAQLGVLGASPSGKYLTVVEAIASDRGYVAGELKWIATNAGSIKQINTGEIDVSYSEWSSENKVLIAGHRGFESVVAWYDPASDILREFWSSAEISTGGSFIAVSGCSQTSDVVLIGEGYQRAPEIALISNGRYEVIKSFDLGYGTHAQAISGVEKLRWTAPDGLSIEGWLLTPRATPPYPLIMQVHGGPVGHSRPVAMRGWRDVPLLMLLSRGYAIFFPNPRGSIGRGQGFIRRVLGDMGGADTGDLLSGIDHLVARGLADPRRLGVSGVSYGGFMTSWLIAHDQRFSAAVSVAPFTNQVSEHLLSNIPQFVSLFLADHYSNRTGYYFERSPVMYARQVRTPTLNVCGALDRSTPPEEAMQFHRALLENGTKSVLITYPCEGHGIRKMPARIDYAARVVSWFERYVSSSDPAGIFEE